MLRERGRQRERQPSSIILFCLFYEDDKMRCLVTVLFLVYFISYIIGNDNENCTVSVEIYSYIRMDKRNIFY